MMSPLAVMTVLIACAMVGVTAQRSPYAGASDPGVLPQYLSENELADRLGGGGNDGTPPPKIHEGTLETEALYNRVQSWPDDRKPYWFLNAAALQAQREQQQQQQAQVQNLNRQSPFAAGSRRTASRNRSN